MARKRKNTPDSVPLKHPDRSGPSEQTLLELAQARGLFDEAKRREEDNKRKKGSSSAGSDDVGKENDDEVEIPPVVERILETLLWTVSLTMLHFTLDVLVQNQYAMDLSWWEVSSRAALAFLVFALLFYVLHPHSSNPTLLPGLPARFQSPLRQTIFFLAGTCAGCYLIHITNKYSYIAVMSRAPPLGCIWVWSIIELNLPLALVSLTSAVIFLRAGGYDFK
ncbi:hypothetical protein VTK73DRAFT_7769 [Phialemonium thermophilum]|uniref:DUF7719 domain-containing protein n=1 Tax=Phialemonium thermophilum TaxID=223376 RepID=A0ABR3XS79_9PEZI